MIFLIAMLLAPSFSLWEEHSPTPVNGLSNPYQLSIEDLKASSKNGRLHALNYPVNVTGILLPYAPVKQVLDADTEHPIRKKIYEVMQGISKIGSFDEMNAWLGLHQYPETEDEGPYYIPKREGLIENRMGFSMLERVGAKGFTFSCAACHTSNVFGKKIMGLTNRFPRANEFFVKGKSAFKIINKMNFQLLTDSTDEEVRMLTKTRSNLRFVEAVKPRQLGLDTSLAHVALSLSHRKKDEYAKKTWGSANFPREEPLRKFVADSKPGVWWNVKYKNRWLLDGSLVSGNPILTGILWNEIGRGTDLHDLEDWFKENNQVIEDLTTAVFSATPPQITDFFTEDSFDLEKAKLGQKVFEAAKCNKCHGDYQKAWDMGVKTWPEVLKTTSVKYPEQTLVKDVGTDPNRWQGMASLLQLNNLAISKKNNMLIKQQEGYVPPPLVGIWVRWPYFHNNSIPNLCALVSPPEERPVTYYAGEAKDPNVDFDFECNGYPLGNKTPEAWKTKEYMYDTTRAGMRNTGHYKMFLDEEGNERFSQTEKMALIHFLQTL
ncbi:MAG: hypothetical protein KDD37_00465 [Bdellovibrionales bacterium]|nr:hypothetical protein [Bdellovibrionales bacterium]